MLYETLVLDGLHAQGPDQPGQALHHTPLPLPTTSLSLPLPPSLFSLSAPKGVCRKESEGARCDGSKGVFLGGRLLGGRGGSVVRWVRASDVRGVRGLFRVEGSKGSKEGSRGCRVDYLRGVGGSVGIGPGGRDGLFLSALGMGLHCMWV